MLPATSLTDHLFFSAMIGYTQKRAEMREMIDFTSCYKFKMVSTVLITANYGFLSVLSVKKNLKICFESILIEMK